MFEPAAEDTWTMCAFVVLVVIIGFGVYRRIKYVKQTSSIYANLLQLNSRYHFHGEILREYRIDDAVPAKSRFDNFNFDAALDKHISANLDYYLDLLKKIYANQQGYRQYTREVDNVIRQDAVKLHEVKKDFLYSKIEAHLCEKCKLHPRLTTCLLYSVSYSSPKGKNQYHKEHLYSLQDVQLHYEQVLQAQKHLTDEKRRRQAERAKMSPSLRYSVLRRDHFRCQICGATQSDGVKLHVDHIVPIAKGGKTELENLRTLCDRCNLGKGSQSE